MDSAALADVVLGGRYRLHSLLGSGGMGLVSDGWDERLNRPVAVKVLRSELAAVPDVGAPNAPPPTVIAPIVTHRNGGPGGRGN